jgi:hypothetical protein
LTAVELPFRIRIGVTGHRALAEPERIAAGVREALADGIWGLFDRPVPRKRQSIPLAFTILTALAEGSDRLVADEVLGTPESEIEVVLPMGREEYSRDFAGQESVAEFDDLYKKATKISVLNPSLPPAGIEDEARKQAYEAAGRFVVDQSDLLIAVWDGKPPRGRGGTAEIVAYARERRRPLIIVSAEEPGRVEMERGAGLSARAYDRIAAFDHFPISGESLCAYAGNVYKGLFSNPEGDELSDRTKAAIKERLIPWYVRASLIAKRNQKRYFRSGWIVYALSPLAIAAVVVGILAPAWASAAFSIELAMLLTVYAVIKSADRAGVHKKWLETRFLAERIRSAIFLSAVGAEPATFPKSRRLGSSNRGEEWVLRAFDEIMLRAGAAGGGKRSDLGSSVVFVRSRWIAGQIGFHAAKAARAGRLSRLLEKAGRAVFVAAIGAAAWHLLSIILNHRGFLEALEKPAVFLAVVLPAVGAALGGVRAHKEYSRLEKQSLRMEGALRDLDARFAAAADFADFGSFLREAERLMLEESQEWLTLMTFARVEAI